MSGTREPEREAVMMSHAGDSHALIGSIGGVVNILAIVVVLRGRGVGERPVLSRRRRDGGQGAAGRRGLQRGGPRRPGGLQSSAVRQQ